MYRWIACFLLCSFLIAEKLPVAPLPNQIISAKKVFLVNSGANEAFDCFYNDLKQWGRYDLVDSPDAADLVIEIGVHSQNGGTRVWSATKESLNKHQS